MVNSFLQAQQRLSSFMECIDLFSSTTGCFVPTHTHTSSPCKEITNWWNVRWEKITIQRYLPLRLGRQESFHKLWNAHRQRGLFLLYGSPGEVSKVMNLQLWCLSCHSLCLGSGMNKRAIFQVQFWVVHAKETRQHSWANSKQADTGGAELFMLWTITSKSTTSICSSAISSSPVPSKEHRDNDWGSPTANFHTTRELVRQLGGLARAQELVGRRVAADRTWLRLCLLPSPSLAQEGKGWRTRVLSLSGRAMTLSRNI